jgi:hypothetical protein
LFWLASLSLFMIGFWWPLFWLALLGLGWLRLAFVVVVVV